MEKSGSKKILNWKLVSVGLLLIHLFLLVNLKFTGWPEMTLWPYLTLKGWLPYRDIAIAHTPFLLAVLTFFYKFFGVGLIQLKFFTWIVILATDVLIYFVVRKLWDSKAAVLSLLFYIPLQIFYEGNGLWFDLALTPIAVLTYYCLIKKNYLWVGICWALAFLTKQTAFWFLLPITISTLQGGSLQGVKKRLEGFIQGTLLVFVPVFVLIWLVGILPEFIFWAFKFGVGILPKASGQVHFPTLRQLIIYLAPFSLLLIYFIEEKRRKKWLLILFSMVGVFGVYPRWELYHFQPAIPFLAITSAIVFSNYKRMKPALKVLMGVYLIFMIFFTIKFYVRDWGKTDRFFEPEILNVASYIKQNVKASDRIFIINAWDHLYVLSDTLPATKPWIPHLSWYMELPGIQEKMVSDLSQTKPKLIIQGEYTETGLSSYKPKLIDEFIRKYYTVEDKIGNYLILIKR